MRFALVLATLLAVAAPAHASPADIIDRPLTLERGQFAADLVLEVSVAPDQFASPASIAPDLWYGVTDKLTVGVIHSDQSLDRIPFFFEPGTTICIRHNDILCTRTYHGSSGDVLYSILAGQIAVAAHARLLLRDIDPVKPALTLGAMATWRHGRFSIYTDPYVQWGLANQDLGNRAELWLPLVFAVQPTWRWVVELHTGYDSDAQVWRDGYHIPVELGTRARVTRHFDVGGAFGFSTLLGPQNTPKERIVFLDVAWRS